MLGYFFQSLDYLEEKHIILSFVISLSSKLVTFNKNELVFNFHGEPWNNQKAGSEKKTIVSHWEMRGKEKQNHREGVFMVKFTKKWKWLKQKIKSQGVQSGKKNNKVLRKEWTVIIIKFVQIPLMIFLPLGFCPFYHSKHQVPKWLM